MAKRNKINAGGLQGSLFTPSSDWRAPSSFPDLSQAKVIGVDVETKDPNLKTQGPGTIRRDGFIAGVSIDTDIGFRGYFPVRHLGGGNLDPDIVFRWLKKTLSNPKQIKVGANLLYDLDWLNTEEVEVAGPCYCVQVAEALIDEEKKRFSLEVLSQEYLGCLLYTSDAADE